MSFSNTQTSREHWEDVDCDPTPEDLGYDMDDWEVIRARKDESGHLMFLPDNKELLHDEAFIVADTSSVCDVIDRM